MATLETESGPDLQAERAQRDRDLARLQAMISNQEPLGSLFVKALNDSRVMPTLKVSGMRYTIVERGLFDYLHRTDPRHPDFDQTQEYILQNLRRDLTCFSDELVADVNRKFIEAGHEPLVLLKGECHGVVSEFMEKCFIQHRQDGFYWQVPDSESAKIALWA